MLLRLIWCTKSDWTDDDELGTDISTNICPRKMVQPQEKNFFYSRLIQQIQHLMLYAINMKRYHSTFV